MAIHRYRVVKIDVDACAMQGRPKPEMNMTAKPHVIAKLGKNFNSCDYVFGIAKFYASEVDIQEGQPMPEVNMDVKPEVIISMVQEKTNEIQTAIFIFSASFYSADRMPTPADISP